MKEVLKTIGAALIWACKQLKALFTLDERLLRIEKNQDSNGRAIGHSIEKKVERATSDLARKIGGVRAFVTKKTDAIERDLRKEAKAVRQSMARLRKDLKSYRIAVESWHKANAADLEVSSSLSKRLDALEETVSDIKKSA